MAEIVGGTNTTTRLLRAEHGGYRSGQDEEERPSEPWKGEHVKSVVYAELDAMSLAFLSFLPSPQVNVHPLLITILALTVVDVLVLRFTNPVSDGISMGLGDYMSSNTKKDVVAKEKASDVMGCH
ncbi:unnamed protein product [Dovyalis caffra]|uniref:Uncharacterized protein n=1 Tax=Dovyalis caffra TaxID=77055 RepID=A0AAV1SLW4_9ROSI|nr:unnamed protein product [Dovyalis caffra]